MTNLTPIEIERQEFKVVWRGYDPTEVRAFLGQIAHQLTSVIRDQERVAEELALKVQRLNQVEDYEERLRDALLAASQLGEQTREDARREAELVVREAELRADQLLIEGHQAQRMLLNETQTLKRQRERLSAELRSVVESHLRMLDNQEEHLKSAQERWEREEREWDQRWSESGGERLNTVYRQSERAEAMSDALSEARELTLALSGDLAEGLDGETASALSENSSTKPAKSISPPLIIPSIPEPLAQRPLVDLTSTSKPKGSAKLDEHLGDKKSEQGSGVARLQRVLSTAAPLRPIKEVSSEDLGDQTLEVLLDEDA